MSLMHDRDLDEGRRMREKVAAAEAERASTSVRFRAGARVVVDMRPSAQRGKVVSCEPHCSAGTIVTVQFDSGEVRRLVASRVKLDRARRAS